MKMPHTHTVILDDVCSIKVPTEALLTSAEVAALLRITGRTLGDLTRAGQVPAVKVGKLWRYPAGKLMNWLQIDSGGGEVDVRETASEPTRAS